MADAGEDAFAAACSALRTALERADRIGEVPNLIWLSATPGIEESVIAGIQSLVGTAVPIVGGSSADNSIAGEWSVWDGFQSSSRGLLLSVFFPSVRSASAFHSGYTPTERK
ncbi:FIST N-terminal domain-containing protein, partial [Arthrospira platensis SPKY2]